jgi:hypothetical protein
VRGYIYNNPKLAYEGDGYWYFLDKNPHAYWLVLREQEDGYVLLAPIIFDVIDNLPESVIDSCPVQIDNVTIGIGRCITRPKEDLTTEPVIFFNPEKAKQVYNILARSVRGDD